MSICQNFSRELFGKNDDAKNVHKFVGYNAGRTILSKACYKIY